MVGIYLACIFYSLFHPMHKELPKPLPPDQLTPKITQLVCAIEELYDSPLANSEYWPRENITQKEHALQSARLAQKNNPNIHALIAAALLHSLSSLLNEQNDLFVHKFLKPIWGEAVAQPILSSNTAQRFLAAVDSGYVFKLSEANQHLLEQQGGALSQDSPEYTAFRKSPYFERSLALRRWHDEAKAVDKDTPSLKEFHELLIEVAIENLQDLHPSHEYKEIVTAIDQMQKKIQTCLATQTH